METSRTCQIRCFSERDDEKSPDSRPSPWMIPPAPATYAGACAPASAAAGSAVAVRFQVLSSLGIAKMRAPDDITGERDFSRGPWFTAQASPASQRSLRAGSHLGRWCLGPRNPRPDRSLRSDFSPFPRCTLFHDMSQDTRHPALVRHYIT